MAQNSDEPKFSLRLVIDEEKKKVVLAEACRDFVDVLFSFLTLPMGTIVRLLEKHRNYELVTVGCFSNLYKSVLDMSMDNFETEACKKILLNPRNVKEVQCKKLKVNINPAEDVKFFRCSNFSRCKMCSNFSTSRCRCGELMNREVQVLSDANVVENKRNGVFISSKSAFIITDDLKLSVRSTDLVLKKLKSLDCCDFSKVGEKLVDLGFEEVMTLLRCIFSSNAPLTDIFLNKQTPQGVMKTCESLSPLMEAKTDEAEAEEVITLSVIVMRKHDDMKVLYVECGEDFVDLLFTFLAVPLEGVLELFGDGLPFECIGNLFRHFKEMSGNGSTTESTSSKSLIHHYYKCQKQLLNVFTDQPRAYYYYMDSDFRLTTKINSDPVVLMDPKSHGRNHSEKGSWFVKRDTKFIVFDDLVVKPMNSSSTICLLKKFQIHGEDLEVQEINISKTEATNLLRASLVTSSALNTALRNLILKKHKS